MSAGPGHADLRRHWRNLVEKRLPEAAAQHPRWPVRHDHCFARILLDNACGGPWRERVDAPAWANMPPGDLSIALALGEAVLADRADLAMLNRRSLAWRGKASTGFEPAPLHLREGELLLRRWSGQDDAPFAALNADLEVMRHCPATKTGPESVFEARILDRRFVADGFGPWAVACDGFLGFVGGMRLMRAMPFPGGERPGATVEIAWRLARAGWGRGIATRAAHMALADLFGRCRIAAVVAFTAACNARSRAVMERLGMTRADDFLHPALPQQDRLQPHVLYRLTAAEFTSRSGSGMP